METMSFVNALRNALEDGYTTLYDPEVMAHQDIADAIAEIEDESGEGVGGWIRFGAVLVHAGDAWKRTATVYYLS